jgi:membrane-associated HD superfamily phosphohydrolase
MPGWLGGGDADDGSPRARALRFHGTRALIALLVAAITYLVFPASPVVDSPILEVGSVAPDNVIAPFGYSVLKSPEELAKEQNDIARSVEPIFSIDSAALDSSRALLGLFDQGLRRVTSGSDGQRTTGVQQLGVRLGVQLTPAGGPIPRGAGAGEAVVDAVRRAYDRWLSTASPPVARSMASRAP